jgi:hypothetical protein
MTIQEAYKRFLLKISKNDTGDSIHIGQAEFVFNFNEQAVIWLNDKLSQKSATSDINDIQELLVENLELSNFKETKDHNDFQLPDNFYHYVTASALAERDGCEKTIEVHNIKPKDKNTWLKDDMNNPSFEWEETISVITNKTIQVYKSDFDIIGLDLSYYRKPIKVDIEGYLHTDRTPSKTIHPDLSDENVNEIINRCALEVDASYKYGEAFQLDQQRIINEK